MVLSQVYSNSKGILPQLRSESDAWNIFQSQYLDRLQEKIDRWSRLSIRNRPGSHLLEELENLQIDFQQVAGCLFSKKDGTGR